MHEIRRFLGTNRPLRGTSFVTCAGPYRTKTCVHLPLLLTAQLLLAGSSRSPGVFSPCSRALPFDTYVGVARGAENYASTHRSGGLLHSAEVPLPALCPFPPVGRVAPKVAPPQQAGRPLVLPWPTPAAISSGDPADQESLAPLGPEHARNWRDRFCGLRGAEPTYLPSEGRVVPSGVAVFRSERGEWNTQRARAWTLRMS